jgi:hypothetical protein
VKIALPCHACAAPSCDVGSLRTVQGKAAELEEPEPEPETNAWVEGAGSSTHARAKGRGVSCYSPEQVDEPGALHDIRREVEPGLAARKVLGWPKNASWPMHSCGNTSIKDGVGPTSGPTWGLSHLHPAAVRHRVNLPPDEVLTPNVKRKLYSTARHGPSAHKVGETGRRSGVTVGGQCRGSGVPRPRGTGGHGEASWGVQKPLDPPPHGACLVVHGWSKL